MTAAYVGSSVGLCIPVIDKCPGCLDDSLNLGLVSYKKERKRKNEERKTRRKLNPRDIQCL